MEVNAPVPAPTEDRKMTGRRHRDFGDIVPDMMAAEISSYQLQNMLVRTSEEWARNWRPTAGFEALK